MKVKKRSGELVAYDRDRVETAIGKALGETDESIEWSKYEEMVNEIEGEISDGMSVEEISDIVEGKLGLYNLPKTARSFILYREERRRERSKNRQKYKLLTDDFLSKYKHKPNPFPTELGEFVYYRTYSRFLPEYGRREYWWETVARSVDYNCSLGNTTKEEAEELFDNIYNLRQFLSGRTTFVGGTDVTESSGLANFNCAGVVLDEYKKLSELFLLLMLGTGVGLRVLPEDVDKLPKVRTDIELVHQQYQQAHRDDRLEHTEVMFKNGIAKIIVGDSRFGWMKSLQRFMELLTEKNYSDVKTIVINYNSIRPKGEMLKTFGGYASGHKPLMVMFDKIMKVIKNHKSNPSKMNTIDVMDMANIVAENVVSGGSRRSSEVTLFDKNDKEIYTAKSNMFEQIDGEWKVNKDIFHRRMSNNSIFHTKPPTFEEIKQNLQEVRYSGEPGIVFAYNAEKRRENFKVVNP